MVTVAAVDVGSSATRLAILELGPTGLPRRRESQRYPLRLGASVFATGRIDHDSSHALLEVARDIVMRLERRGVSSYRAVATSAMRDAHNGLEVAELVRSRTGLELEVISGAEEGRIMRLTLTRALGTLSPDCLLVDLGGGSLELERTVEGSGVSLPLGTVRLLHRYPALVEPLDPRRLPALVREIAAELANGVGECLPAQVAIGTGGNLDALARLAPVSAPVPAIDLDKLARFAARLARLHPTARAERFGLRQDRADVILPAALVILALARVFDLELFVVPGTGVRESILYTLVAELTRPSRARDLLRASSFDLAEPDRRARVARRLFDLLPRCHGLWPPAAPALEAAAYVLDGAQEPVRAVADGIRLLRESPELDLEPRLRSVAAHALRFALEADVPAGRIAPSDRKVAELLGAILRLSDALTQASPAWEPEVSLIRDPLLVRVGLTRRISRRALAPLQALIGRRLKVV